MHVHADKWYATSTACQLRAHINYVRTLVSITFATPVAYMTEHLSLTLSVRSVPWPSAAIAHIHAYGLHHTDCTMTESAGPGSTFVRGVSAGV